MASVRKISKDGPNRRVVTVWQVRWRDPEGRQRKKLFPKKSQADDHASTVEADKLRGQYVDPNDPTTFRSYAEVWRVAQVHRPTTQAHVETHLRRHVYPHFGDRRLSAILPSEVQAWVKRLSADLAPTTVQVIHGIVASIFKAAARDRKVTGSPCESTKLPRKQPRHVVPLETVAVEALIAAVLLRFRGLLVLAAGTGMRQGEAFGLTLDRASTSCAGC